MRAVLRRTETTSRRDESPEVLRLGDLEMHLGIRAVVCADQPVTMTSTEFSVLEVLLREAGRVVAKAELSEQALGRKLMRYDRSLDMHVSSLRKKLGPLPDGEERIKTVRGVGLPVHAGLTVHRLLWKIFISFWVALILFSGATILTASL